MTPMEAWRVISANMAELYKRRKTECYKGYTDADIEAEVICFNALRKAQNSKDVPDTNVGNKSEWIRVEERFPDSQKFVIVCDEYGNVGEAYFYKSNRRFEWVDDEERVFATHWMPLPEPPKGE